MSEETQDHNDGTWSGLKKTIIGLLTTVILGAGGVITNKLIGDGDEPAPVQQQAAPVINITNSNQQQPAGNTTIIRERVIEKPESQTIEKNKPVKKKESDEFKEEPPKW
jgi:hypothetical protein